MSDINYDILPEDLRGGMRQYIENGIMPGHFLKAVICNDLTEAFGRADHINRVVMHLIASFVYNEMPMPSWGSKDKMTEWIKTKELESK